MFACVYACVYTLVCPLPVGGLDSLRAPGPRSRWAQRLPQPVAACTAPSPTSSTLSFSAEIGSSSPSAAVLPRGASSCQPLSLRCARCRRLPWTPRCPCGCGASCGRGDAGLASGGAAPWLAIVWLPREPSPVEPVPLAPYLYALFATPSTGTHHGFT